MAEASVFRRPDRTEAVEYFFRYIEQVPGDDVRRILEAQTPEGLAQFKQITEERSLYRYAPDKWSIRQVLSHVNDTERVFAYRVLWFARGFEGALPGFDQTVGAAGAEADSRSWDSHVDEFVAVRRATTTLLESLPDAAWDRRGVASGNAASVRGFAFVIAGHSAHHLAILRERYL